MFLVIIFLVYDLPRPWCSSLNLYCSYMKALSNSAGICIDRSRKRRALCDKKSSSDFYIIWC